MLAVQHFSLNTMAFDNTVHGGDEGQGFSFFMPVVEGVAAIRIYEGDRLLFERTASGPAPALQLESATAWQAEGTVIRWALRSGPTSLMYRVRFSPDGGQTWQVLALNSVSTTLTVPPVLLSGATQPVVEVQAVDGVRADTLVIPLDRQATSHTQ